jgi:hypothetical protein
MKHLDNFNLFNEKLILNNYDEYAKLVADAYEAAPEYDESVLPSYRALIDHAVNKLYPQILGKGIDIQFVKDDPYADRNQMAADVENNKVLKISKLFNDHPVFTAEENLKFRAVHDYYTHIVCNQDFGLKGELKAYNTHARLAPPAALPALFTEVVGQACYAIDRGHVDDYGDFVPAFGDQKVAELPGFDYMKVGEVKGRSISNKKLI